MPLVIDGLEVRTAVAPEFRSIYKVLFALRVQVSPKVNVVPEPPLRVIVIVLAPALSVRLPNV